MNILLISQYEMELKNNINPEDPLLLIHYTNYHKKIYQTLLDLGHNVTVTNGLNNELLNKLTIANDLVFSICNDFGYPNGDILVRLFCQKYNKKFIGGTAFSKFYESDKIAGKFLCEKLTIPTPQYSLLYQIAEIDYTGPYILKPRFMGSSRGITDNIVFDNKNDLLEYVSKLSNTENYYIEKFIEGITVTIGCILKDDKSLLIGEPYSLSSINNRVITYEDKKNGGCVRGAITNDKIKKKLKKYAKEIFLAIQPCQIARFDFMLSNDNNLYFLEINGSPNLSCTGGFVQLLLENHFKSYENFIDHLLKTAISSNNGSISTNLEKI